MSGLDDNILQRLFDEELDPAEAKKVSKAVRENSDDAKRLASLAQMRKLIRAEAEAAADVVDFEGLWPAVAARLETPKPAEAKPADPADPAPGAFARLKAWLGGSMGAHPVRWAAAGVCAVAAAVVLGVLLSTPAPKGPPPIKGMAGPECGQNGTDCDNVDIEKIEFKGRHPDIFKIKDGKRNTTVIWVYPEDEDDDENGSDAGDDPGSTDPI